MSVPVALVAGLHASARTAVVDRLLAAHPGAVAVHHDLRAIADGRVVRTVRDAWGLRDRTVIRLEHPCVTCTVREDLLPELTRLADTSRLLVADLWDSVEPRAVAEFLEHAETLRLTAVVTAVDARLTPVDVCRGETLTESGRIGTAGDERCVAEVLARQIEYATALAVPDPDDDLDLCRELLSHLAPTTPQHLPDDPPPPVTGPALHPRELAARVDPATARLPQEAATGEVTTVVWRRTAPLHPARFFDAMDALASESVRSRGRFWLANRPDRMLAWDATAGVVTVEDVGPWLASLPEAAWEMVPPIRRAAAALDWTADHGDRVQHLTFTAPDLDRDRVHALLDGCLLTPDESPENVEDPFAPFLPGPA
ncbi:CobW family GTP-binding protein [Actinomadura kijaniata]|uniref:CobW family GTP-binding protein n=1 Tax=Actinomadura kijaniata TaxID=46161 RepID=UPI00082D7447|nr:GTP-binding protein [Actinomadura kijaniata]